MKDLAGKTALVTGASRGIGRGIAERLAAAGALVAVNYASNAEAAAEVVRTIEAAGGEAFAVGARLGKPGAIDLLVSELADELTRRKGDAGLDILVNNIGGSTVRSQDVTDDEGNTVKAYDVVEIGDVVERPFGQVDIRLLDDIFDLNVFAPFLLTQALRDRINDNGRIINISSVATRTMTKDQIVYNMSKAAIEMFTKTLAKVMGQRGITVNSVGPGITSTETVAARWTDPAKVRGVEASTLLGRFGEPSDIADFVHALASPAGRWITAQTIDASGGLMFL